MEVKSKTSSEKFNDITVEEMKLFVGDKSEYYIKKWDLARDPSKFAGWNWAAFFIGIFWMGYRKMYISVLCICGIVSLNNYISDIYINSHTITIVCSVIGLCIFILAGIFGNALYFRHMKSKMNSIKSLDCPSEIKKGKIKKDGNPSWMGVLISILVCFAYGSIFSVIRIIMK